MTLEQQQKNLSAFLNLIGYAEGAAYNTLFGGTTFSDYSKHPNKVITVGKLKSTAAGKYQILYKTYLSAKKALNLSGFTPAEQDKIAVYLIKQQGAYNDVLNGRFETAVKKCSDVWASLPFNGKSYYAGQTSRPYNALLNKYLTFGGVNSTTPNTNNDTDNKALIASATVIGVLFALYYIIS